MFSIVRLFIDLLVMDSGIARTASCDISSSISHRISMQHCCKSWTYYMAGVPTVSSNCTLCIVECRVKPRQRPWLCYHHLLYASILDCSWVPQSPEKIRLDMTAVYRQFLLWSWQSQCLFLLRAFSPELLSNLCMNRARPKPVVNQLWFEIQLELEVVHDCDCSINYQMGPALLPPADIQQQKWWRRNSTSIGWAAMYMCIIARLTSSKQQLLHGMIQSIQKMWDAVAHWMTLPIKQA